MSIIRTVHNKENPYVLINKNALRDSRLSLRAIGLWARCLSYPDDWKFSVKNLEKECPEGRKALYTAIDELIKYDYVVRFESIVSENGRFKGSEVDYVFFEFPASEEDKQHYADKFKKCFRRSGFRHTDTGDTRKEPLLSNEAKLSNEEPIIIAPEPTPVIDPPTKSDQTPAAGNNKLFSCLDSCSDLSPKQKRTLMAFPEHIVTQAVRYYYHADTPALKGPAARIKALIHFCKNPEDFTETMANLDKPKKRETRRESLLKHFVKNREYNDYEFTSDDLGVGFYKSGMYQPYMVYWKSKNFIEEFIAILKKIQLYDPKKHEI